MSLIVAWQHLLLCVTYDYFTDFVFELYILYQMLVKFAK